MDKHTTIRIGSRASKLAHIQAELVTRELERHHPEVRGKTEIITFSTSGDAFVDRPLSDIGGKGLFTKELEEALFNDKIDMAVHSMKDMATTYPDGLIVPAICKREDPRDMVVGPFSSLQELPEGCRFGTSSLRRAAQIRILRPDIQIVPFRGNVQTRLQKLEAGEVTATMLACAGLNRLHQQVQGFVLEVDEFLPAVAQGAIGIQCREDRKDITKLLRALDHAPTHTAILCERAFLKVLDGSCRTPIAGFATIDGDSIRLRGIIAKPDGSAHHRAEHIGITRLPEVAGETLGMHLKAMAGEHFIA